MTFFGWLPCSGEVSSDSGGTASEVLVGAGIGVAVGDRLAVTVGAASKVTVGRALGVEIRFVKEQAMASIPTIRKNDNR
jgi:hypothetical protein